MNIISEHGYRQDGRKPDQVRNLNYKLGVYAQADGSAYLEQGNTKVLCAVYGPHESRQKNAAQEERCIINCQYSMATFSTNERRERPRGDRRSTEFAKLMEKAFETVILTENYPRSQIDIFCELLQADGSNLSACINAATLALCDGGIAMRSILAAASCVCAVDGTICVDISHREQNNIMPQLTVANIASPADDESNTNLIALNELTNRLHSSRLLPMLKCANNGANQMRACLQLAVSTHLLASVSVQQNNGNGADDIDIILDS